MAKKNVVIFDGEDKFINPKKAIYSKSKGQSKKGESFKSAISDDERQGRFTQNYGEQVQDGNENANQSYSQQYQNGNETIVSSASPVEAAPQYVIPNVPEQYDIPSVPEIPAPPVFNITPPSLRDIINPTINFSDIAPVPPLPTPPPVYEAPAYVAPPPIFEPPPPPVYVAPTPPLPTPSYEEEPTRKTMPIREVAAPLTTSTLFDDSVNRVLTPVGGGNDYQLPVYNPTQEYTRTPVFGNDANPPSVDARSPVSGIGLTFGQNATTAKTCPEGMRDYFGTCIPLTNQYAVCQQGYMKEYEGGPCVPIPRSGALGGCAAGYEYKMGMRSGSLTPEMGCYPIGSNQDIGTGSSTGAILGGGSGSNIGGGGTTQGGGGTYNDDKILKPIGEPERDYPIDMPDCVKFPFMCAPVPELPSGTTKGAVPCPAGFRLNEATGTCIESTNPQDYKCPPIPLPPPPLCQKYVVVGKDEFGCERLGLVDDLQNCPKVEIIKKPITSEITNTTTKAPVTSQTTNTTTKAPTKDTLGQLPTDGGGAMGGGGGGGGSEEEVPAAAAVKKNYFWWYVGGAVLTYYLYKKYYNKNN